MLQKCAPLGHTVCGKIIISSCARNVLRSECSVQFLLSLDNTHHVNTDRVYSTPQMPVKRDNFTINSSLVISLSPSFQSLNIYDGLGLYGF